MRALLAPLVLAAALAAPLSQGAGPELLKNPQFTLWTVGDATPCPFQWDCSEPPALGAVVPTPQAFSAPFAVVLPELARLQQDVSAREGLTYRLGTMFQHPQGGHCMAVIRIIFYDAAGGFLERPTDHIMDDVEAWTEKVLVATAPAGTSSLRVHLAGGCLADPPGVFVVDDVTLTAS